MKNLDKISNLQELNKNELATINGGDTPSSGYMVGYGLWLATFGWVQSLDQYMISLR